MPAFLPYLLATAVMALSHFDIVRGGAPVVPVFAFTYATGCPMVSEQETDGLGRTMY